MKTIKTDTTLSTSAKFIEIRELCETANTGNTKDVARFIAKIYPQDVLDLLARVEQLEGAFVRGNATQTHMNLYSLNKVRGLPDKWREDHGSIANYNPDRFDCADELEQVLENDK